MKDIYLFVHHLVLECEDFGIYTEAFSDCEEAYKAFAKWRDEELLYCKYWVVKENTENYFAAYEEGDYCANHCIGYVVRLEVK